MTVVNAEELIGKRLVFVLAQRPHGLEGQIKIATLWPVMNLEDGSPINCSATAFPSHGYVRWYRVPTGSWQDGDLVTGLLQRNENNGYQQPNKEWYQVLGDKGERANGVVCELISLPIRVSNLHSDLNAPHVFKRPPTCEFYLQCEGSVVGPFKASPVQNTKVPSTYRIEPARSAEGDVDVYDRNEFESSGIQLVKSTPNISSSEYPPVNSPANVYSSTYRVFRRRDLVDSGISRHVIHLLSDELLITKACKQIRVGKNWKNLRDELKTLVAAMRADSTAVSQAVAEGLPRLLSDAQMMASISGQVTNVLLENEMIKQQIAVEQAKRIEAEIAVKASDIEAKAQILALPRLTDISILNEQLDKLKGEISNAKEELERIEEARLEAEMQGESILSSIRRRLDSQRSELFADLALLGPLFSSEGQPKHLCSLNTLHELPKGDQVQPVLVKRSDSIAVCSEPISERQFVSNRLHPLLNLHGCCLSVRDAEFFHVCMLASRIVGVSHPGWAVAYANAMGELGSVQTFSASPDWLSFDMAFSGSLASSWRAAAIDTQRLHVFVLDGIDRCPSHAWLRPWINITAGWTNCFPDSEATCWPDNIRLCLTQERSTSCFEVPKELRDWVLEFDASESSEAPSEVKAGHFPLESWQLPKESNEDPAFHGFSKHLEIPQGKPFTRSRTQLGCRLRHALIRLNEEDSGRCEPIITKRIFRSWAQDSSSK